MLHVPRCWWNAGSVAAACRSRHQARCLCPCISSRCWFRRLRHNLRRIFLHRPATGVYRIEICICPISVIGSMRDMITEQYIHSSIMGMVASVRRAPASANFGPSLSSGAQFRSPADSGLHFALAKIANGARAACRCQPSRRAGRILSVSDRGDRSRNRGRGAWVSGCSPLIPRQLSLDLSSSNRDTRIFRNGCNPMKTINGDAF